MPLSASDRARLKREQMRKLIQNISYGTGLQTFLSNPRNISQLTHQEIADYIIDRKQHTVLAENLENFRNLSNDTKSALIKNGLAQQVQAHEESFGETDDTLFAG